MLYRRFFLLKLICQAVKQAVVSHSLPVQFNFRFQSQLVLFAWVKSPPTIKHIVQIALYQLGTFVHKLKPIPKGLFVLYKLTPSIEKLRDIVLVLVEML